MRALCLLLGVVLFSCLACGSFVETVRTSTLSTDQEVPTILDPPPSAGIGICILARNRDPPVLDCEVQHDVSDVTGAHIHVSPRGSAGPVVYSFSSFAANHFRESFSIEGTETYPAAAQINDFLSGHWYINVHSLDYPSGEVRGQLENTDRFYARLSTSNTIPHASGTSSHGLAVGTFSAQNPLRELAFDIVHSVQQPLTSGLEIRQGAPGQIGPLVYSFRNAQSPAYETVEYTINEQAEFLKDLHYLNVLSTRNPTGEIRGQMVTIDYIDQLSFTARLDAEQAVPQTNSNNRGAALFAYHCDTKILEYVLMHNVPDARGAFISAAPAGEPGVTLFSLGSGTSPIYGAIQLTTQEELLLYSFGLYTSVISVEFPQGEIRGQITVENDWWAYLSGTNVVSPVTTPAMGIATMHLYGEQNRRLDYSIFHSVQSPLRASINVAREGENGPLDLVFPSAFSPVRGNDIVFDDDELEAFVTEGSYITLTSVNYPFTGEVRGQIRRVNPCKASNDNSLTVSISGGDAKMITENEIEKEEQENISFYAAEIPQSVDDTQSEDEILMGSNPYYFNQQTGSGTLLTPAFILSFCLSLLITYL